MWERWIFEREWEWVCEALETAERIRLLCCQLFPLATPVSQPGNTITHLFGPKAFVSLGAAIKAPSAWKCGITDKLLQGPVAWPFSQRFTTQAVNHTHHIVTHSSNAFLLSSLSIWLTTCYCTSSASHPAWCVILIYVTFALFFFLQLPGKWMEQVSVGYFSVGIWGFAPETYEKDLTKRPTATKNTLSLGCGDPPSETKTIFGLIH